MIIMQDDIERLADVTEEEIEKVKPQMDSISERIKKLEADKQKIWSSAFAKAVERVSVD